MMWVGMIGGFLFILIQLILIVDFAHGIAQSWVESYEEDESRGCFFGLIGFTLGCYGVALIAAIFMYIVYASVRPFFLTRPSSRAEAAACPSS